MPHGDRHAADVEPFALSPPGPATERLSGLVERVVFHNPATGFCVLRVKLADQRDLATFVGECAQVGPGEVVRAEGSWQTDPNFGRQFRTRAVAVVPPSTTEGMEAYLASGMIKGIGRGFAKKLVAAFGDQVFEVIEHQPQRLRSIPGIGSGLAQRIARAWSEQKSVREIMLYLHSHGLSPLRAARIFETYGERAIEVVSANPYRLAQDIRGVGFASADELASRLGIPRDSPFRLRAGLCHVLEEALGQGHCGLPREELAERTGTLLGGEVAQVEAAIDAATLARALLPDPVEGTECLFLPAIHQAEDEIAMALAKLGRGRPAWAAGDPDARVAEVEQELALRLAEGQRAALRLALVSKLLIITGGPGTGKTTLVEAILAGLGTNVEIALAAPTGRAARRLGESTGREAKTLHRLLEAEPGRGFRRDAERPLSCDLLVVDEMSMVDVPLMQAMLAALPEQAGLLLVGDADQLPSVGPGQVLADLIASERLAVIRLEQVFRQAAQSQIVRNAHLINHGTMPELARDEGQLSDFYAIKARGPEEGARLVLELVSGRIPARFGVDPADIQVLCPTNRGELGARHLNQALQAKLNPDAADRVERYGVTFVLGDKVMQLENDYEREVYNGDLGRIVAIDHAQSQVQVEIDARPLTYGFNELDRLVPAYAITVHKAQGSEYPVVVLPLARQHGRMLRRNLVYTAVTRARRLVILVVEGDALELAIAGRPEPRRWSRLRALLQGGRDQPTVPIEGHAS
jgi:exodeoxyribonuclease V alpha subunit